MRHGFKQWIGLTGAAVALVALTGCRPIVDRGGPESSVETHATYAVAPKTIKVFGETRQAVEIRIRDCHTIEFPGRTPAQLSMRPFAFIVDATGRVIYENMRDSGPQPIGSTVVSGGTSDAHRITVPVDRALHPLSINAGCTLYPGAGSAPLRTTMNLPVCTTSNRTCAASTAGAGQYTR